MKGKKNYSPFQKLVREIESYLDDLSYQSQLYQLGNDAIDDRFMLGQYVALKFILERAYSIYHNRVINTELCELSPEEFLKKFRETFYPKV